MSAAVFLFAPQPAQTPTPDEASAVLTPGVEVWGTSTSRDFTTTGGTSAPATETVYIDAARQRQKLRGVGASLTPSSAELIAAMPASERRRLLEELFAPDGPVRLNIVRIPFGGSDFVSEPAATYDDLPAGESDWQLERFSTAADDATLRPVLREIVEIAPNLVIIAAPWSPPAWLKDSATLEGGRLIDDDRVFDTYARYLTRAVTDYADAGLTIHALSVQNEPQARHPDGYPGADLPVDDAARLIERLGPALSDAGLTTGILAYDHNWSLHPADAAATPPGEDPHYEYPADLLRTAAAPFITGVAYHCYSGDATRQSAFHDEFPDRELWLTECSGSHAAGDDDAQIFSSTLDWQSRNLLIATLANWGSAVLTWNLALDPDGGPHRGGCDTCTGVVTIAPDGTVTRNAEYYVLASVGRFVAPGSAVLPTRQDEGSALSSVAFDTGAGFVAVVFNPDPDERVVRFERSDGPSATAVVPGSTLATVVVTSPQ